MRRHLNLCLIFFLKGGAKIDNNIYKNGFDNVNSYIYGLIVSDGCLIYTGRNKNRLSIMLGLNDKEMIEKLHKYMCFGNKVYKQNKQYSIKYRNEESIDFLIKNGLIQRKSLEIDFPILPIEFMPSFIRGYFDGDGSISLRIESDKIYGRVAFTSGSINFLRGLQNCLYYNFNIMSHIYDGGHKDTKTMALVITRRSEIDKLYNMMYDDTDFYLYRKYNKFVELSKYKPKHKFKCMI